MPRRRVLLPGTGLQDHRDGATHPRIRSLPRTARASRPSTPLPTQVLLGGNEATYQTNLWVEHGNFPWYAYPAIPVLSFTHPVWTFLQINKARPDPSPGAPKAAIATLSRLLPLPPAAGRRSSGSVP